MSKATPENFVTDLEVRESYSEDVSGETMVPDYVVRPSSTEEISECLRYCSLENLPVTCAGGQSCDTASGLAEKGVLLSSSKLTKILDVDEKRGTALVEPGAILFDMKKTLAEQGYYYPPDPSSEHMATLGGTVATNAAGARSFRYGATSRWISGMEVVLADGTVEWIERSESTKNSTGPSALTHLPEMFVGSEGVLGVLSKVQLRLLEGVPRAFALMCFFPTLEDLISFAIGVRRGDYKGVSPRSFEYLDESCLRLIRESKKFPQVPSEGLAAAIIEQEYDDDMEDLIVDWYDTLQQAGAHADVTIVAETDVKIEELRGLRHYVPSHLNEQGQAARAAGGRKVSTDWAVPLERMAEMSQKAEVLCVEAGFSPQRTFRYAHLGDGHPHYNFIPKDTAELEKCFELRRALSKLAVSLGGTVSAEHGIGKLRKDLLAYEENNFKLRMLKALKLELDPKGILAPGNLI